MTCESGGCGTLSSDTFYYPGSQTPIIHNVRYDSLSGSLIVTHSPSGCCNNCVISIVDPGVGEISAPVTCNATVDSIVLEQPCKRYEIKIICSSEFCGESASETYEYMGCPCPGPQLDSLHIYPVFQGNEYIGFYYQPAPGATACTLHVLNGADNEITSMSLDCSQTHDKIELPACGYYKFYISCENGESGGCVYSNSDTLVANHCYTDSCVQGHNSPITLSGVSPIPAFLSCGYIKPCLTCYQLVQVLTPEFRALYPAYSGVPYLDSTATDDQVNQNALWARFINYRTGFSQNALVYMQAFYNCTHASPPVNAVCETGVPANDPSDIYPPDTDPCEDVTTQAQFIADLYFNTIKDSVAARFDSLYKAKCLGAQATEVFYMNYRPKEYHYTLYYYDQAGNLVKTLPPAAVKPNYTGSFISAVFSNRVAGTDLVNPDNNVQLATEYRYNSLNQVSEQKTPDAGVSHFWYDKLGRLVVSQNAKQVLEGKYSYTQYDPLGRISQVGQKPQTTAMTQTISRDEMALKSWIDDHSSGGLKEQITRTVYDVAYYGGEEPAAMEPILYQKNLRNRVSYTQVIPQEPTDGLEVYAGVQSAATFYSYDIHGNVDTLVQDLNGLMGSYAGNRYKKMVYDYDLISGKVNRVAYQPGMTDEFYHLYTYDDENRITNVKVSHDSVYWENDATYDYYRHGPLSRTSLGEYGVQGIDYAYTIQGWLKGVNSNAIRTDAAGAGGGFDMGLDGANSGGAARDAFSYSLNYFSGDYSAIGGSSMNPFTDVSTTLTTADDGVQLGRNLFNGNIRAMITNLPQLGEAKLYAYRYDQLNRIKAMNSFNGFDNSINKFGTSNTPGISLDYKERISYDPNGNIKSYFRNGTTQGSMPQQMDSLIYSYNLSGGNLQNNKLRHVKDAVSSSNYTEDIDDQVDDNYAYDAIGNLVQDKAEGLYNAAYPTNDMIEWNVYGKISKITKIKSGVTTVITYSYDASGNRISKSVAVNHGAPVKTIYTRDASGNVMSIYTIDPAINGSNLTQSEISEYGSSRLGVWTLNRDVSGIGSINLNGYYGNLLRGNKSFELTNHLGNVLATISDKRVGLDANTDGIVDYAKAEVVTANDYYPFGMRMVGRKYQSGTSTYRYSINGQEKSDELNGNLTSALYWEYDSRIGRRWNIDPKQKNWESSYLCFSDNPILFSDFLGDEADDNGKKKKKPTNNKVSTKNAVTPKKPLTIDPKSILKIQLKTTCHTSNSDIQQSFQSTYEAALRAVNNGKGLDIEHGQVALPMNTFLGKAFNLFFPRVYSDVMHPVTHKFSVNGFYINNDGYVGEAIPTGGVAPMAGIKGGSISVLRNMTYTSKSVADAARQLQNGLKIVNVASQAEAEELFLTQFVTRGYKNTTGYSTFEMKDPYLFPNGKAGTYHWDFFDTQHGGVPHLQIHTEASDIIRIFFQNSPKK